MRRLLCFFAMVGLLGTTASAQQQEGAFVEYRLALQLSDATPEKEKLVLSVAYNVLKTYGPDKVAIEVVAFGPGVDLLKSTNANAERVASLVAQGVRFDVCNYTLDTIERETGLSFPLNPLAKKVEAGVPYLLSLARHGYLVVRP